MAKFVIFTSFLFASVNSFSTPSHPHHKYHDVFVPTTHSVARRRQKSVSTHLFAIATNRASSLVVVSPPGGVGEVTAVKAAELGTDVRWFVVSQEQQQQVVLSQESLDRIAAARGSVQVAGADVPSLLLSQEETGSAVTAVRSWCGSADTLVCTFDGADTPKGEKLKPDQEDPKIAWKNAIKVAAREAAKSVENGTKIALISMEDMEDMTTGEQSSPGLGSLWSGLLGSKVDVPETLELAMSPSGKGLLKLRYGQIFGTPESSPDFSPLVGGPRRDPVLCEEYSTRTIRVDPTLSLSGNFMMGKTTRSSRHAVGEAAALIARGQLIVPSELDVSISSQPGTDSPTEQDWINEFSRVKEMLSSGQAAQLFTTEFASVPDTERLADWLAYKWAPAVLRTYDIAAIRTGGRPVFANRAGEGKVEVVWQQLVDFESITVGRMVIQVTETSLTAVRAAGDPTKGFGAVSNKPLKGEDVLVRLLAGAASQATEKGLANKPTASKPARVDIPTIATAPVPIPSQQSIGDVATKEQLVSNETGPRQAGARRSTERNRRKALSSDSDNSDQASPSRTK